MLPMLLCLLSSQVKILLLWQEKLSIQVYSYTPLSHAFQHVILLYLYISLNNLCLTYMFSDFLSSPSSWWKLTSPLLPK